MKKHISQVPTSEITKIGAEASLKAREKALMSGKEIISKDAQGRLVSEKMNEDGSIEIKFIEDTPK